MTPEVDPPLSLSSPHVQLGEGLRYYIVRPDKKMIPLIPADQLPVQISGIPQQLTHQQLSKGKWMFVTETTEWPTPSPPHHCALAPTKLSELKFVAPDHRIKQDLIDPSNTSNADSSVFTGAIETSPRLSHSISKRAARPVVKISEDSSKSLTESFANIYQKDAQRLGYKTRALPPSGIEPDPSKKEYCTYWIRTGDCAFTAEGCRYKHEMPNLDKLREIGFTRVPPWWKEKSGLRGATWMQRRLKGVDHEGDDKQVLSSPRKSIFREMFEDERKEINHQASREKELDPINEDRSPADDSVSSRHAPVDILDLIDLGPRAPAPIPSPSCDTSDSI